MLISAVFHKVDVDASIRRGVTRSILVKVHLAVDDGYFNKLSANWPQ